MLGKGAILTVFGFILAFSMYQVRMSSNVLATSDNFNRQYVETLIHESAISAMNYAINKAWDQGISNDSFYIHTNECTSRVRIYPVSADTTKITVRSWGYLFDSETQSVVKHERRMISFFTKGEGTSITEYFMFMNNSSGLFWVTGDTLWGPCHDNSVMHTKGSPVFYGKMSANMGINPDPASKSNQAEYHDGWEIGSSMTVPTDMTHIVNAAIAANGAAAPNTKCIYNQVTSFEFLADGNVVRKVGVNPPDTVNLAALTAPEGVIFSTADVRIQGTLDGQVTIYSTGNIWLDGDMRYKDNPMNDINSDDILGLIAQNNIIITDNVVNQTDVYLDACILCINGGFEAENWNSRPTGIEYFLGSLAQNKSGCHGFANSGGSVIQGFDQDWKYDPRLWGGHFYPPNFPGTPNTFRLTSWWE
jgi:hypothetical protein